MKGHLNDRLCLSMTDQNEPNKEDALTANQRTGSGSGESSSSGGGFEVSERTEVTTIGRYVIIERLGKGGFGFVYLATDPQLQRNVAIKVPRWDRNLSEDAIGQFLTEGKMLAQVNHPSIVGVHDVGLTDDGIPFVVMEFVEGKDLSRIIKNETLGLEDQVAILLKIAIAIQQAHKKGIVHRDFKPANVIVDDDGGIHLVDFGLALHDELSGEDWDSNAIAGTPGYMAPEQIRGETHLLDGQTDIWAFGVTMYRMFTGVLPFKNKGQRELTRAICYKSPKPPRQLNEKTPRQLERICLRCMEKLMFDRYQSMADVIEELEAYQQDASRVVETGFRGSESMAALQRISNDAESNRDSASGSHRLSGCGHASGATGSTHAESETATHRSLTTSLAIVPKGLRSFDQNDKDFFLQLLPGPTDRRGIPESIRFWTHRLGSVDQIDDVSIGVIYGPSGSGKSSFVRAGLIPQLPESVIDIYIDCTQKNLEQHISKQLSRVFQEIPEGESLVRTLRQVRCGEYLRQGDKLLLVLDQFEQWLSSTSNHEQLELTEALRQCDSGRVQSLLLIRDEFWLSTSQYLKCLGQRIVERHNAMPLPLFDKRHARRVLEAIGRAYSVLPPEGQSLGKQQKGYIKEAVESLSTKDRVICVHLTVFAETTKNSKWEVSQLRNKGGWAGIGRDYVAGIFSNPETPSFIKQHSQEAWAILQQLLPATATELKGTSVLADDLFRDSHVSMSKPCFDELMRFLEFDCNLISRIDNPDPELGETDQPAARYGLTHDFLVSPIRDWGNAKQNETLSGRATSQLTQLANQWKITRDRRFLPSLWDFGKFSMFADSSVKGQHGDYWRQSRKLSTVKGVGVLAMLGLIFMLGIWGLGVSGKAQLESDFNDLLVCVPRDFGDKLEKISPSLSELKDRLLEASRNENPNTRFRANCARLVQYPDDEDVRDAIVADLSRVSLNECATLVETSKLCGDELASKWKSIADDLLARAMERESIKGNTEEELKVIRSELTGCCRLAIHLAYLGDMSNLTKVMAASENPLPRSVCMLELPKWHMGLDDLLGRLDVGARDKDVCDLISGVCSGVGLRDLAEKSAEDREKLLASLRQILETHFHGGVHYAAWFALKRHKAELPNLANRTNADFQWKHLSVDLPGGSVMELPMVWIPPGEYISGAGADSNLARSDFQIKDDYPEPGEPVRIEKGYWICTTGISTEHSTILFEPLRDRYEFVEKDLGLISKDKEKAGEAWDEKKANSYLSLFSSMLLSNELSRLEDRQIRYKNFESFATVKRIAGNGFRLASESELELAWRSNSITKFFTGNEELIASILIGETKEAASQLPMTAYPPNANGLFGCGVHSERVDTIVNAMSRRKIVLGVVVKGGVNSPARSADARLMYHPEIFTDGICRFVLDEE